MGDTSLPIMTPLTTFRPIGPSCDLKICKLFPRILHCFHILYHSLWRWETKEDVSQKGRTSLLHLMPRPYSAPYKVLFIPIGPSGSPNNLLWWVLILMGSSDSFLSRAGIFIYMLQWGSRIPKRFHSLTKYPVGVKAMSQNLGLSDSWPRISALCDLAGRPIPRDTQWPAENTSQPLALSTLLPPPPVSSPPAVCCTRPLVTIYPSSPTLLWLLIPPNTPIPF